MRTALMIAPRTLLLPLAISAALAGCATPGANPAAENSSSRVCTYRARRKGRSAARAGREVTGTSGSLREDALEGDAEAER